MVEKDRLIRLRDAAPRLGIALSYLKLLISDLARHPQDRKQSPAGLARIPAGWFKDGRDWRISERELDRFIESKLPRRAKEKR